MTELTPTNKALLRAAFLKHLSGVVGAAITENKKVLDGLMHKGDSLSAWSPLDGDEPVARVSKSKPKPQATITNRAALASWIEDRYPEKLHTAPVIIGSDAEVLEALQEHAPHLVAVDTSVPDWAYNELRLKAEKAGQPIGYGNEIGDQAPPGIEVTLPDGALSVVVDKMNGPDALQALWDAHLFAMDGTVRELPAPE